MIVVANLVIALMVRKSFGKYNKCAARRSKRQVVKPVFFDAKKKRAEALFLSLYKVYIYSNKSLK